VRIPRLRNVLATLLVLFAAFYLFGAVSLALRDDSIAVFEGRPASLETIAIFGASGTAGDGILKAAMAAPEIRKIHVFTRRVTPRIEEGVTSGRVQMTLHMDYLDYAAIREQIAEVDAVFWAIGISARGVDEKTYGMIHVDFPRKFAEAWTSIAKNPTFHFTTSARAISPKIPA